MPSFGWPWHGLEKRPGLSSNCPHCDLKLVTNLPKFKFSCPSLHLIAARDDKMDRWLLHHDGCSNDYWGFASSPSTNDQLILDGTKRKKKIITNNEMRGKGTISIATLMASEPVKLFWALAFGKPGPPPPENERRKQETETSDEEKRHVQAN